MSKRLSLYADVKPILDEALASGGGSYTLASHSAAIAWRHRAYRFRKAYAEHFHDYRYDRISFPNFTDNTVRMVLRQATGIFTPPSIANLAPEPLDEITAAADELARRYGKDIIE